METTEYNIGKFTKVRPDTYFDVYVNDFYVFIVFKENIDLGQPDTWKHLSETPLNEDYRPMKSTYMMGGSYGQTIIVINAEGIISARHPQGGTRTLYGTIMYPRQSVIP